MKGWPNYRFLLGSILFLLIILMAPFTESASDTDQSNKAILSFKGEEKPFLVFNQVDCSIRSVMGENLEKVEFKAWVHCGRKDCSDPEAEFSKENSSWWMQVSYVHREEGYTRRLRVFIKYDRYEYLTSERFNDFFINGSYTGSVCNGDSCKVSHMPQDLLKQTHSVVSILRLNYNRTGVELQVWKLRKNVPPGENSYLEDEKWLPLTDELGKAIITSLAQERISAACTPSSAPLLNCSPEERRWRCHEISGQKLE